MHSHWSGIRVAAPGSAGLRAMVSSTVSQRAYLLAAMYVDGTQDMSWKEFKERYLRPNYLQFSFLFGALTIGLRVSAANYTFDNSVSNNNRCPISLAAGA